MDTARYAVALFVTAFAPGVFLFWFSIHPGIRFWRRFDARLTLAVHYAGMLGLAAPVYLWRETLLAVEFGTRPVLVALGLLILTAAGTLRLRQQKHLNIPTLMGLPELAPERYPTRLVTDGIYARLRHPRYVEVVLAFLGYALFSNYLAAYAVFLLSLLWVRLLAPVEEKELRARFGQDYARYCEDVPRFIPRLGKRRG